MATGIYREKSFVMCNREVGHAKIATLIKARCADPLCTCLFVFVLSLLSGSNSLQYLSTLIPW